MVPFVTGGDPDPAQTVAVLHALANAGSDVIELGVSVEQVMRWFDGVNRSRLTLEAERIYRNSLRIS